MKKVNLTNLTAEPSRYYFDGLQLWGIYEMPTYTRRFSSKPKKKRYWKGPVENKYSGELLEFKSFHKTIQLKEAEDKYPEYFI